MLNYAYTPILGRLLDIEGFGDAQLLTSIFNQTGILLGAFQIVAVIIIASKLSKNKHLSTELERLAVWLGLFVAFLLLVLSPWLSIVLGVHSVAAFYFLAISIVIGVIYTCRLAHLQAKQDFLGMSVVAIGFAVLKIIIIVGLVVSGAGVAGVPASISIALLLAILYMLLRSTNTNEAVRELIQTSRLVLLQKPDFERLKSIRTLLWVTIIMTLYITMLYASDVILVKALFNPTQAGEYAGISTVARIIFFATTSFAWVLVAKTGTNATRAENRKVFLRSLAVVTGIGSTTIVFFALMPDFIIRLLIGSEFLGSSDLLFKLGVLMMLASILNVIGSYLVTVRKFRALIMAIVGGVSVAIISLVANHASPRAVVVSLIFSSTTALCILCVLMIRYNNKGVLYVGE